MRPNILVRSIPLIGYLALQGLLIADVVSRKTGYGKAGVVSLLASLTVWFLFSFADCILRDSSLHIESHWGGLGGGVGGFRISRSLIYLSGTLCFGMLLVLAYYPPQFLRTTQAVPPSQTKADGAKNPVSTKVESKTVERTTETTTVGAGNPESTKVGSGQPEPVKQDHTPASPPAK